MFKERHKEVRKERRKSQRQAFNRMAEFKAGLDSMPRWCMVTDISDNGARLFTEIVDVPERFTLSVTGDGGRFQRQCRLIWRLGGELGVEFVDRGPQ